jgi:caffeoyl-CoA O-methyltransferase
MKDISTKKSKLKNNKVETDIVTTETFTEVARHDWNSEDEVGKFLASLVTMSKYKTILEIGVFEGETTQHLIKALPKGGQYVGIDINDYRTNATKLYMAEGGKSIDFILGNSHDELKNLPTAHFDLIFVDGDHSWASILPEFKLVEKLLARGGVIAYHDTIHLEDPKRIVDYAAFYKYNTTTLNTPEGRGISLICKY